MKTFKQVLESIFLLERADSLEDIKHKVDTGAVSKVMGKSGQNRHGPLLTSKGLEYAAHTREHHTDPEVRAAFKAHHSNPEHPLHASYLDRSYEGNKVGKGGRVASGESETKQPTVKKEKAAPTPVDHEAEAAKHKAAYEASIEASKKAREDNESSAKARAAATAEKIKASSKPAAPANKTKTLKGVKSAAGGVHKMSDKEPSKAELAAKLAAKKAAARND